MCNRVGGVMVTVLACAIDAGLEPQSGQTKDFKIGICCFSAMGFSRKKYLGGGGVGTLSMIWGTTTRILIIFGVPPHKYKYLKMTPT